MHKNLSRNLRMLLNILTIKLDPDAGYNGRKFNVYIRNDTFTSECSEIVSSRLRKERIPKETVSKQ